MEIDTLVTFLGNIIGVIGAVLIMKYELKQHKKEMEANRIENKQKAEAEKKLRIKIDIQMDIYKNQLTPILQQFINNIFVSNSNLMLIKDKLYYPNDIDFILKIIEMYEKSMIEGAELGRQFIYLNLDFKLLLGESLYEKSEQINLAFKNYNSIQKQIYINTRDIIDEIITYTKYNKDLNKNEFSHSLSDKIKKNIIYLYNDKLLIDMNKLYYLLNEYSAHAQNEFLSDIFNKRIEIPNRVKQFNKIVD